MKESYWGYWLVILGVFVVIILLLIKNITSNNSEDFYNIRQINESAMVSAIDYAYYREYGELKINKEKFMENFLRMFGESASRTSEYEVTFASIYEAPPKASVEISSKTDTFFINSSEETFDINSRVDAVLESGGGSSVSYEEKEIDESWHDNITEDPYKDPTYDMPNRVPSKIYDSIKEKTWFHKEFIDCSGAGLKTLANGKCVKDTEACKDNESQCVIGGTLKKEYREDADKFINKLMELYQKKELLDSFNSKEKETFMSTVRKEFANIITDKNSSDTNTSNTNTSRVPDDIRAILVTTWAQEKYYNCDYKNSCTIKDEWLCYPTEFANELLNDYQEKANLKYTEEEKNQFLKNTNDLTSKWGKCDASTLQKLEDEKKQNARVPESFNTVDRAVKDAYRDKYEECYYYPTAPSKCVMELKCEYRNNLPNYCDALMSDYQKIRNIEYTEAEKQEFIQKFNDYTKNWGKVDRCN